MKSLIAVVLLLQLSPALATAQPATIEGCRLPGIPPNTETPGDRRHGSVEVTFTKWRTAVIPPTTGVPARYLFKGIVGGDLGAGDFVGEVLDREPSTPCTAPDPPCTPPTISGSIIALHAIYEVQVGEHSFTALIRGGTNGVTGDALLDGVILAGWRTGARVHVAFQTLTSCPDAPQGTTTCFQGVIRVGRAPRQ